MRGDLNDAVSIYFLDATLASAFVARWCAPLKIETEGGVFRIRGDQPAPRIGAGNVPLGYDASERTLVINPAEGETVRRIFALYRELGCVRRVKEAADRLGLRTKYRTTANGTERGGKPFSRGHLYTLLSNPIYTGRIAHKGELHPGQQPALIDDETWVTVRDQLAANTSDHRRKAKTAEPSLLAGLLG